MQDLPTHALASPPPAHTRIDSKGASSSYHGIRACNKGKCLDMHDTQAIIHAPPSLGPFRLNEVCPNGFMYENPFGAHLSGSRSLGLNLETVKTYSDADFGSSIPSGFGGGHSPGSELMLLLETMVEPLLASHQCGLAKVRPMSGKRPLGFVVVPCFASTAPTAGVVVVASICSLCFLYIVGNLYYLLMGCFLLLMLVYWSWALISTFCNLVGLVLIVRHG
ncbi:hypothetical protein POTOM_049270 [Populus tomentosa]|uniref:Uncharacterized protein n=1 Tax=Populus tomentosa TaxID=118781 RepID=A0A8X7YDM3_POPTO|nr:hypothetical protein POTOM_049270 [Populus tomentosa]